MQNVNYYVENYIEPVIEHPVSQAVYGVLTEVVKIIAAKVFLELLGKCLFGSITEYREFGEKTKIRSSTIRAPLLEEVFFRGIILRVIQIMQNNFRFASHFYFSSEEQEEESKPVIYFPIMGEMVFGAYIYGIHWMTKPQSMDEKDEQERIKLIFRAHLSAIIFAAAHLINPHPDRASALGQFVVAYIWGIINAYLTEKYNSLAPSIFSHGFHNSMVIAIRLSPDPDNVSPYMVLALLVNEIGSYLLGVTSIDRTVMSWFSPSDSRMNNVNEDLEDLSEVLSETLD